MSGSWGLEPIGVVLEAEAGGVVSDLSALIKVVMP
jgi:hypothetical protein